MGLDITPDWVDEAVSDVGNAVVDAGDYVLDKAGDGLRALGELGEKTVGGLWDIAKDGLDIVMGAVRECMQWLWDQVPEFILHPFGDPGPLEEAAAAWRVVIDDIERTRNDLVAGGRTLGDWKGPAAARFDAYLDGLVKDTGKLGEGIEKIAKALSDAAAALRDLNRTVHAILAEIAAYIVVDVILTLLTGFGGAAAAAAQVAVMVARVTSAIRKAVQIIRRLVPVLREARALQALAKVTFKVDDVFDLAKAADRADTLRKWASTGVSNSVGVSVATGKDPSQWGAKEVLTVGIGTVASVKLADKLKPLWQRTTRGPDSVLASATNSSVSSGSTNVAVQVITTGTVDPKAAAISAATGGLGAGGARSATFAARGQGVRGRTPNQRVIAPKPRQKPTHVSLTERQKSGGRMIDGLAKGGLRAPFTPDPPTPSAPNRHLPLVDDVPKRPFGRPTYTVRPGDDLTTIAHALLGDGNRWPELVGGANPAISNPDLIHPGQTITLRR